MRPLEKGRILARRPRDEFFGRSDELEMRTKSVLDGGRSSILSFAPRTGATELLLQLFDEIFRADRGVVPVYFAFSPDEEAADSARRFLADLVTQVAAFRLRDPRMLFSPPTPDELAGLVPAADSLVFEELFRLQREAAEPGDLERRVRNGFGAPLRAARAGIRTILLLDDLHALRTAASGGEILRTLIHLARHPDLHFFASSRRRSNISIADVARGELKPLAGGAMDELIASLCLENEVKIADPVSDLLKLRSAGDLGMIRAVINAAAMAYEHLETFEQFARVYAGSQFGGELGAIFSRELAAACVSKSSEREAIRLLHETYSTQDGSLPIEVWQRRLGATETETLEILNRLHCSELVRLDPGHVEAISGNVCLRDHVEYRYRLEIGGERRAAAFAAALSGILTNAPKEMAHEYRRASALGLRELLSRFEGNEIPAALLDYGRYRDSYKGLEPGLIRHRLKDDKDLVRLPRIVFSAHAEAFYKAIGTLTESERAAIAVGFERVEGDAEQPVAWIAAEIDSKLEADPDLAGFWCDRLEMAALMGGFERYKLWLIAPEGFTPEALRLLGERGCYGSSRVQAGLLKDALRLPEETDEGPAVEEYEIVIPMSDDSEMVAAHALEEIAKRHNFSSREINQIKTALVEACINATEHSHSLDRRIHQKFLVAPDHITIIVSNRGIRLLDRSTPSPADEDRRGWGLNLMRQLMDDVKIEQMDDGTRISMTKYFQAA